LPCEAALSAGGPWRDGRFGEAERTVEVDKRMTNERERVGRIPKARKFLGGEREEGGRTGRKRRKKKAFCRRKHAST